MENLQKARVPAIEEKPFASTIKKARLALSTWDWNHQRERSVNRRIFAAMLTVGALSSIVKVASTLKEVVVARQFGVGDELDAFLIAFLLPSVAISVVTGSFNAALIPTYIEVREHEGRQAAQKLFSSITVWGAALLIAASILMALAAPYALPLLGSGFGPDKLALTRNLFFILLPSLPLSGLFVTWAAVLNAGGRFALAAITPILTPVAMMIIILVFGYAWGIYSAAIAIIVGTIAEGALLAAGLRKQGISPIPRWHGLNPATRQVMRQYVPMIAAGFLMSGTGIIDQALTATLGAGSVSILNYANKMSAAVVGIGTIAISTAILPQFSRMVAAQEWGGVRHTMKTYTRLILIATIPLTLCLIVSSEFLVRLLFQRGAFTTSDTLHVSSVQTLYMLQLPVYLVGMLFVRLISALKANLVLLWGTFISFVLNIIMDYVLMKWMGVAGIALSTSIVYLVACAYLSVMALRVLKKQEAYSINQFAPSRNVSTE